MKTYFSTFISGTQEIVKVFLEKRKIKITLLLDGLVVYESNYQERDVRNFQIFNNTFILIRSFDGLEPSIKSIEKILTNITNNKNTQYQIVTNLPVRRRNFKIVSSLENQTVAVNRELLKKIETIILRVKGMRLNINKPDLEIWTLLRREGYGFFGIRITYPDWSDVHRERGELRKEIAYILCLLSMPAPKDVVLDPFAGSGAIPMERAVSYPYKDIFAVEKDLNLVSQLKQRINISRRKMSVLHSDALTLREIKDKSIDKIITDPPWGDYQKIQDIEGFYEKMLTEFNRILKPNGIIVLLISAKEMFENILKNQFDQIFKIRKKYDVLVSGKKVAIYQIIKTNDKR